MFTVTKLSGDILTTIKSCDNFDFNNISYDELKILFDTNINTGLIEQPYFMILNINKIIYTNLYDIEEMKKFKNGKITTTNVNIIFLPYKKEDVEKIIDKTNKSCFGYYQILESNFPNEELKSDKLFVKMALSHCSDYYKYISNELKEDNEIIDIAIKYGSIRNLKYITKKYKEDYKFMKIYLDAPLYLIEYAGYNIKDNKEIVINILNEKPEYFQYISKRLRNNKEIIQLCIQKLKNTDCKSTNIMKSLSSYYKDDKSIVIELLKIDGKQLEYVSNRLKKDNEVVYTAINNDSHSFIYADKILFNDKKFILLALTNKDFFGYNGYDEEYYDDFLEDLSDIYKDDKEIVLAAVKRCGINIKYASNRLKNDKDVVLTAIDNSYYNDPYDMKYILEHKRNQHNNIDIILNETKLQNDVDVLKLIINKIKLI